MKYLAASTLGLLLAVGSAHAQTPQTVEALDGLDPVILIQQGKEVFGRSEHSVVRGRFRYLFASADSRAAFEADPTKYEIQLGGLCARMGRGATGNPADYLVHDGRIYIFGSDSCHNAFAASPATYLDPVPDPISRVPADERAGRALIERAVGAVGGRDALRGVNTYVETATLIQERSMGEVRVTQTTTWRANGDLRQEQARKLPDRTMTIATVLTQGDGWFDSGGRAFPMIDVARASVRPELQRHPFVILRELSGEDAQVAAAGPANVQGTAVEQVRIVNAGIDVTLGIDAASGAPRTLAYVGRNDDGEVGRYVLTLSDFRPVDGLRLPFKADAHFNGQPDRSRSWTVESIRVNAPLDEALFRRPAGGK